MSRTPGPWETLYVPATTISIGIHVIGPDRLRVVNYANENANIIAAAPDLLDAAETGIAWMQWWLDMNDCECENCHTCGKTDREIELAQMRTAVAKAKRDVNYTRE